jgi:hypothetical protein
MEDIIKIIKRKNEKSEIKTAYDLINDDLNK